MDLDVFHFGQHGHGGRRRVDAPRRLGHRDPLHSMHSGLVLERAVGSAALDLEDDLLDSAEGRLRRREDAGLEAQPLGVAHDHPLQFGGEQSRLVASGSGPHLHDGVLVIARILLENRQPQLLLQGLELVPSGVLLLDEELLHLRIEPALVQHGLRLFEGGARLQVVGRQPVRIFQVGMGLGDLGVARLVAQDLGIGQFPGESRVLLLYLLSEPIDHVRARASFCAAISA